MTINLPISRIILLIGGSGPDLAYFETNIKEGIWPYSDNAKLKLEIAKGHGECYIKDNFSGVKLAVIDVGFGTVFDGII